MSRNRVRRAAVQATLPASSAVVGLERRLGLVAVLVVALAAVLAVARGARSTPSTQRSHPAVTSAAGTARGIGTDDLVVVTHLVSIPEENMPARDWAVPLRWRLPDYTRARALTLLADVPGVASRLACDATGCTVLPPMESVASLSPVVRSRVYSVLAGIEGNPQAGDTFYRSAQLGPFSAAPGIPSTIRPLMDTLTWNRDGVPAFSDLAVVCDRLGSPAACHAFVRAMLSRPTASVTLRLRDADSIERFAASFVEGAQPAVRARLNSALAAGETGVPLEALLPPWAQSRLGTFPAAGEDWTNCFWSSLRFVDRASGPVGEAGAMGTILQRDFVRVPSAARFGDILVVRDAAQQAIHSATWLLAGYLFEKNGYGRLQAWRIVPLAEVMMEFPNAAAVDLWRRRDQP